MRDTTNHAQVTTASIVFSTNLAPHTNSSHVAPISLLPSICRQGLCTHARGTTVGWTTRGSGEEETGGVGASARLREQERGGEDLSPSRHRHRRDLQRPESMSSSDRSMGRAKTAACVRMPRACVDAASSSLVSPPLIGSSITPPRHGALPPAATRQRLPHPLAYSSTSPTSATWNLLDQLKG